MSNSPRIQTIADDSVHRGEFIYGNGSDGSIIYSVGNARWEDGYGNPLASVGGKWTVSGPLLILLRNFQFDDDVIVRYGATLQCNGADYSGWKFQSHKVRGKLLVEDGGILRAAFPNQRKETTLDKIVAGVGITNSVIPWRLRSLGAGRAGAPGGGGGDGTNKGGTRTYDSTDNTLAHPTGNIYSLRDINQYSVVGMTGAGADGANGVSVDFPLGINDCPLWAGRLASGGSSGALFLGGARTNSKGAGGTFDTVGGGAMRWACYGFKVESGGLVECNGEDGDDGPDGVATDSQGDIGGASGASGGGGGGTFKLIYGPDGFENDGTIEAKGGAGGIGGAGEWYFDDTALTAWAGTTDYELGDYRRPTSANGFGYEVTADAGSSDAGEPTWPTTPGQNVVDGGITWTCRAESGAPRIDSNGGDGGDGGDGVVIIEEWLF